jgi:RNA binding exosome subunit
MKAKKFLYDAKEGYLGNKIEAARARSNSITYAYDEFLKLWFSNLNNTEKVDLERLFKVTFRDLDAKFVDGM